MSTRGSKLASRVHAPVAEVVSSQREGEQELGDDEGLESCLRVRAHVAEVVSRGKYWGTQPSFLTVAQFLLH